MLPDPKLDWNNLTRFEVGRVEILRNRSAQARRFRMVYSSDVVIAIEVERGTRSVLDVALAIALKDRSSHLPSQAAPPKMCGTRRSKAFAACFNLRRRKHKI